MSPSDSLKYLKDIHDHCLWVEKYISGKTFEAYVSDEVLRPAMERQLEIIGEALGQMLKVEPTLESKVDDAKRIISFRNRLIHGYSELNQEIIWGAATEKVPVLKKQIESIMQEKKIL